MQTNLKLVAAIMMSGLLAAPAFAEKVEPRVVPPTVVSKVYLSKAQKAAKLAER